MFAKNVGHLQPPLLSHIQQMPAKQREYLERSWAAAFYAECFCRIPETAFAVLYADCPSRPNTPVNVLVGLEILKAGFGWSDEELYEKFMFDVQVRYALGYHNLGDGDFDIRTMYYFRQRLARYYQETGVNLVAHAMQTITDQQLVALGVRTGLQRLDSTQIASNIRDVSRLHLAVEAVQRLHRLLDETERATCADWLAPFLDSHAGQYVYRVKGLEATRAHLQEVGLVLHRLLTEMAAKYQEEAAYQAAQRFFQENYHIESRPVVARANTELGSGCLQSLDDLEATYRQKGSQVYKGYVASMSETCDPENAVQLITQIQVAPNNIQDSDLLRDGLPSLKARTGVETVITDGGYGGPEVDEVLHAQQVVQVQTNMVGRDPNPDRLMLADFEITTDGQGTPQKITCPGGQTATLGRSRTQRFTAVWNPAVCQGCAWYAAGRCRGRIAQRDGCFHLSFSLREYYRAERRRRQIAERLAPKHLRPAVEATVRSVKHNFPGSKLPVRGLFRVTCMVVEAAALVNVRRIAHCLLKPRPPQGDPAAPNGPETAETLGGLSFWTLFRAIKELLTPRIACLGC
jgi:hypothetical protein